MTVSLFVMLSVYFFSYIVPIIYQYRLVMNRMLDKKKTKFMFHLKDFLMYRKFDRHLNKKLLNNFH